MRALDAVERAGNRLPDPVVLFLWLCALVVGASILASWTGAAGVHPGTGERVEAVNLLSAETVRRFLTEMPETFTGFPPLGTVLVVMIGIGLAERTGLIAAALGGLVRKVPRPLLSTALVFAGLTSSIASDAGYVILIPLGAAVFAAAGRHPIAGLAAAFAGVSGGYGSNLLITALDPLLAGITETAARMVAPDYQVLATGNYFVMATMVPLFALLGALITDRIVEPRLGNWSPADPADIPSLAVTDAERHGLRRTGLVALGLVAGIAALVVPEGAVLRDPESGSLEPFYESLVALIALTFAVLGLVYGFATGKLTSERDAVATASDAMRGMAMYILLDWSNLGVLTAIGGAELLKASGLGGVPLMLAMVLVSAFLNLVIGSASAKWAIMATVFVPMFMLVGITPEATQAAYRVGDAVTNIITPTLPYFPLILIAGQRYVPGFSVGSLIAAMLPYSVAFLVGGTALLLGWIALDWPLGPGAGAWMAPA
jgi:aminobenzoyl-glutamate transport protein